MAAKISGIVPPLTIPLKGGELDVPSLERHINRLIAAGIDGLFVLGSSGEVAFSTDERRGQILSESKRIVAGRVPIMAGVISTETERVVEHIRQAEDIGVDAVVATAPFYALQGVREIRRHFEILRESTDLPIWAYDIPACVHWKLPNDLVMDLGKAGVLSGVKDSSGDDVGFRFLSRLNAEAGHPLQLLTGHEVVVDGAYLSGADGCVPGLGNVDPDGYVRQWKAALAKDWETVRKEQDRLADLMTIVQVKDVQGFGAGIGAFKTALQLLGVFESNEMPRPVAALSGENVEHVRGVLQKVGLL